ncbi:MAG: hypothetical protein K8S97_03435 [Anaerolineae bacterium]|nr:hypothetical protein [Anaerolineae bacterium]
MKATRFVALLLLVALVGASLLVTHTLLTPSSSAASAAALAKTRVTGFASPATDPQQRYQDWLDYRMGELPDAAPITSAQA